MEIEVQKSYLELACEPRNVNSKLLGVRPVVVLDKQLRAIDREERDKEIVGRIWQLLDGQHSTLEVAEQVAQEFSMDLTEALSDVEKLVN